METMKRKRAEHVVRLKDRIGPHDAWGTEFGAEVFGRLNLELLPLGEGSLVVIDFAGVERSDVSFQREAVVETLRKHRPKVLFVAAQLTDQDLRENLSIALERRGELLLVRESKGAPSILGKKLAPDHQATLDQVSRAGELASSDLTDKATQLSTASSRLSWLWKAGLIERVEGTSSSGGREHRYFAID